MKGNGKTTKLINEIRRARPKYRAVFCFDPKHQVSTALGLPLAKSRSELVDQIRAVAANKSKWVCWSPIQLFPTDYTKGCDFFCNIVYDLVRSADSRFPKAIFIDEMGEFVPVTNIQKYRGVMAIFNSGRVYHLHNYFSAQQYREFHNKLRFNKTKLFAFKHDNADSVKMLTDDCGIALDQLKNLKRGECVTWGN